MSNSHPYDKNHKNALERGQALVEYALIAVLVGIAFGLALAASAPVTGGLFNAVVNDLLRQTIVGDVPDPEGFWETVTKVYEFVPESGALSTNTPANETIVPTLGPSPTPTNTYTATPPTPTRTPSPTPTMVDILKPAPFRDTADQPRWWRIDSNVDLSGLPWTGQFWVGANNFAGAPAYSRTGIWEIDYTNAFVEGLPTDNFSARFERKVELAEAGSLNVRALADDGVRMFARTDTTTTPITLTNLQNGSTNSYVGQSATLYTGSVALPAGTHYIIVEYFEQTGDARLKVDIIGGGANPDDTGVDGAGGANANAFMCNWGIADNEADANTERNLFDDYVGAMNLAGSRCYLEWRGAVTMPVDYSQMQLTFWDLWEFDGATVDGWLEVAEYIPMTDSKGNMAANREAMIWQKVDLNRMGTANFNWTRTAIDIAPLMSAYTSRELAFRFVMQVPAGTTANRQWYIDDIEFKPKEEVTYPVNRQWTLNDPAERDHFITTGGVNNPNTERSGWGLVSNNKLGANGFAFHDSVDANSDNPTQIAGLGTPATSYTQYRKLSISPNTNILTDLRAHALELDGWVDLTSAPNPDAFGNTGARQLSFYHAYDLGARTGLVVQYSVSPYSDTEAPVWTTFSDGQLRSVTTTSTARQLSLQEVTISLESLPLNPSRIRIRFALLVRNDSGVADGWWIDQIRLGRAENNKWTNYPFSDDAQALGPQFAWRYTGAWGSTSVRGRQPLLPDPGYVPLSYASSPIENYSNGTTTYMTLRWPIDLYNDTPSKVVQLEPGGAMGTSNTFGGPAVDPNLTFYAWTALASSDSFRVEWKRVGETDAQYKLLWMHRHNMKAARYNESYAWEPVRVSLQPVMSALVGAPGVGTGAALIDDDIYLRFTLIADANNNARGMFIDDIQIQENTLTSHTWRLWPSSINAPLYGSTIDPDPIIGAGSGAFYTSDPDGTSDGRRFELDWKMGGTWAAQSYEKRSNGVFAFHDSALNGQAQAPSGNRLSPASSSDFGDSAWFTPHDTFNILELDRIIDLRGIDTSDPDVSQPVMNFWTRYHIGDDDFVRVQISHKLTGNDTAINTNMNGRCENVANLFQCYDQERGWSAWNTNYPGTGTPVIWSAGSTSGATMSYGWRRISVNLAPYAYNASTNSEGYQIRVRFVLDALDTSDNYDGWYVDNVEFTYRPTAPTINLMSSVFSDSADTDNNWIYEGKWGRDPNLYLGGTGAPVSLGQWTGRFWACNSCSSGSFPTNADNFLMNPSRPAPDRTGFYTNINNNFGNGSPYPGWPQTDRILVEYTIDITVNGVNFFAGSRNFTTQSDDGVRMKIEEVNQVTGVPIPAGSWNVINNWTDHSQTADQGDWVFLNGRRYLLTLQYFENSGGGVIQFQANEGRFSYSDSPKYGGGLSPDIPAIPYANTSLLGRQILNLTGFLPSASTYAMLELYSKYRLDSNSYARVEVSKDGGFTWEQTGMSTDIGGLDATDPNWRDTVSSGLDNADTGTWDVRYYNLSSFEGYKILIRFRLDRQASFSYRRGNDNNSSVVGNPALALKDAYYNGWWIGRIRVIKFG